jgi:putative zinc ribbon protein
VSSFLTSQSQYVDEMGNVFMGGAAGGRGHDARAAGIPCEVTNTHASASTVYVVPPVSPGRRTRKREPKSSGRHHPVQDTAAGDAAVESEADEAKSLAALRAYFGRPVFVDEEKVCRKCETPFVVTAAEKKDWHEMGITSHLSHDLCSDCRRERSARRALNTQLDKAVQRVARQPDDAAASLALARATAEFTEARGTGDLDRGIAAARRARRIKPRLQEALYWEAVCQELAGRTQKAMTLYEEFVEAAHGGRHKQLVRAARQRIAQAMADNADS